MSTISIPSLHRLHRSKPVGDHAATLLAARTAVAVVLLYVGLTLWSRAQVQVLVGFGVLLLTLLPGLLYLRFLHQRLEPLRDEYLYNLHRLRIDAPQFLPEPPDASKYHARWAAAGGEAVALEGKTIYELKFSTQYGATTRREMTDGASEPQNLVAVVVCTAVLGFGLSAVAWFPPTDPGAPPLAAALGFGFLGAYFFLISVLTRRYFQNDLRPGAYLMAVVRVVTVLLLVSAVTLMLTDLGVKGGELHAVAFGIGLFPTVALQLIRRSLGRLTKKAGGGLEPPFPLGQLDGMDVWTEARLLEVGLEDVQHLAQANLVDVSLATRIPMQRMIDWVDQGLLVLHSRLPRGGDELEAKEAPRSTYQQLRELGVRTATDLVELTDALHLDLGDRTGWPASTDPAVGTLVAVAEAARTPPPAALLTRAAVIALLVVKEPNYPLVRNWQRDSAEVPVTASSIPRPVKTAP